MLELLLLPAFYVFATLLSLLCDRLAVWWKRMNAEVRHGAKDADLD